ncbi:hypothetical protein B0H16DRAFT_1886319 [Mycena metata]|uniref:Uncharacterized protein n=2 Tax=Mycena metata TaxID=1033252 RepID=A0AAD7NCZ5_9AGAR|nr:hypothetical protein B0H16DRAFT_1886319 [Mycena metata]
MPARTHSRRPTPSPAESPLTPAKIPIVDRSILRKLDDMEIHPQPDERSYFTFASIPNRPPMAQSPARVLSPTSPIHLRPRTHTIPHPLHGAPPPPPKHPRAAERGQEPHGRVLQARFRDLGRLEAQLPAGRVTTTKLEVFQRWVEALAPGPSAQLLDANATTAYDDVSVRAHAPLHIHLKHPAAPTHPVAPSIVDALTRRDVHAPAATAPSPSLPDVLIFTYDLRFPIFPPLPRSAHPQSHLKLHYAPPSSARSPLLGPPPGRPCVAVHWRMESCRLRCCWSIRSAWFVSGKEVGNDVDFADEGALVLASSAEPKAKSGMFRGVGRSTGGGGDRRGRVACWGRNGKDGKREWASELLQDAGVRAIVDTIIGMRVTVFVSGKPGCARVSSFTRQVIDERRAVFDVLNENKDERQAPMQNIVELFG